MKTTKLGDHGPLVSAIGLGCMGLGKSGAYGASGDDESIRTIHEAIDRGVSLLDTGDFYGMGDNEMLVGRALAGGRRDKVVVSVKFGAMRDPGGQFIGLDTRPAAVKSFAAYSLKRLGLDFIDVYRPARLDPKVPIEETVGAIADLIKAGYVKYVGLSEVGAPTIRRAHAVHPIADVQLEYALASRSPEDKIFPALHELGISATLYGVLSRGLLSGSKPRGPRDFRAHLPRFAGEAGVDNEALVEKLRAFAAKAGRTPAQVCVAWVLAREPKLVPIVGARTPSQLDVLDAAERPLSADEVAELEREIPKGAFKGSRYVEAQMAMLDSER
ncbi:MAG TPA: aldo/keto reductase [Polyangiaceae bacterium]|jgi:aryl-alcohol dehydrogenase-like predicted oxidoreductase